MPDEIGHTVRLEIGPVLFIDIAGYSKLLINQQTQQLEVSKLGEETVARVPIDTDATGGSFVLAAVAELPARSGNAADAIKALQRLLSIPAGDNASIQRLKIDPIRKDPGFQQLLAGKALVGPNK